MTGIFDGYSNYYDETARLTILKALSEETDYRLNETLLMRVLEAFAINRGRDYLRNQLQWLKDEGRAVILREIGSVIIVELTERGLDHVKGRAMLHGILRPSPVRG